MRRSTGPLILIIDEDVDEIDVSDIDSYLNGSKQNAVVKKEPTTRYSDLADADSGLYILSKESTKENINKYQTRLAVVGYRAYYDYDEVKKAIERFNKKHKIDLIVSGGCTGVDTLSERWADVNNVPKLIILPNRKHGKHGYILRDQEIVNAATHMIAFPSKRGRGTQITIQMAKKRGIEVDITEID